jgi:hypothetical protein
LAVVLIRSGLNVALHGRCDVWKLFWGEILRLWIVFSAILDGNRTFKLLGESLLKNGKSFVSWTPLALWQKSNVFLLSFPFFFLHQVDCLLLHVKLLKELSKIMYLHQNQLLVFSSVPSLLQWSITHCAHWVPLLCQHFFIL